MSRIKGKSNEKGFTLIELLVVAAIIGILLALAIPNLLKARISANEANARKIMQTLRDAEGEFFEQDLNDNGIRDYTDMIGDIATANTLRCPDPNGACTEPDALIDNSFEDAEDAAEAAVVGCPGDKNGYCISLNNGADGSVAQANAAVPVAGFDDFGWMASMTSYNKTGRRDYSTYGDGVIRCVIDSQAADGTGAVTAAAGDPGLYSARRVSPGCN